MLDRCSEYLAVAVAFVTLMACLAQAPDRIVCPLPVHASATAPAVTPADIAEVLRNE